jgi:hypothetical protein
LIQISGTLVRDAEERYQLGGARVVVMLIDAGPCHPFEAALPATLWHYDGARKPRRGEQVTVKGDALRLRTDHSVAAYVIVGARL